MTDVSEYRKIYNLAQKKWLSVNHGIVYKRVKVDYLFYSMELDRRFAVIKRLDRYDKKILEKSGCRTLMTKTIDIDQLEFLLDYIFRR